MAYNYHHSNTKKKQTRDYSQVFAIIKEINKAGGVALSYKELLLDFTSNKTDSLSSLTDAELSSFINSLLQMQQRRYDYSTDEKDKQRKAIIAQFKSIGSTTAGAIEWAEKYGVKGQKKQFNKYDAQELYILLLNAKKLVANFKKGLNKKMQNV